MQCAGKGGDRGQATIRRLGTVAREGGSPEPVDRALTCRWIGRGRTRSPLHGQIGQSGDTFRPATPRTAGTDIRDSVAFDGPIAINGIRLAAGMGRLASSGSSTQHHPRG